MPSLLATASNIIARDIGLPNFLSKTYGLEITTKRG